MRELTPGCNVAGEMVVKSGELEDMEKVKAKIRDWVATLRTEQVDSRASRMAAGFPSPKKNLPPLVEDGEDNEQPNDHSVGHQGDQRTDESQSDRNQHHYQMDGTHDSRSSCN